MNAGGFLVLCVMSGVLGALFVVILGWWGLLPALVIGTAIGWLA